MGYAPRAEHTRTHKDTHRETQTNATNFFSVWLQLPLAKVLVHVATSSAYRLRFRGCWPALHPQQPAGGRATPMCPFPGCSHPSVSH